MYKLLIADDEQWIRQGLREIINWGSCNIHEVWEAADGEDALYKVREFKPDIVIADIRMPEIDGLELSAILREEFPQTKVIIISGYKDFDYARKAVELGVSNYILKPIDENSIIETVKRCIKEIDREREMLREQEIMKRQIKKNIFLLKQEFILSIFEEGIEDEEAALKKLNEWGIYIKSPYYYVFALNIDDFAHLKRNMPIKELDNIKQKLVCEIESWISSKFHGIAIPGADDIFYGCMGTYSKFDNDELKNILHELTRRISQNLSFTVTIGVSLPAGSLNQWKEAYKQVNKCLCQKFFLGKNRVIVCEEAHSSVIPYKYNLRNERYLLNYIKLGDKCNLQSYLENMRIEIMNHRNALMEREVKSMYEGLIDHICRELCEDFSAAEQFAGDMMHTVEMIRDTATLDNIHQIVLNQLMEWCSKLEELKSREKRKIIQEVINYISQFYSRKITLSSAAEYVHLNASYLSKLFCDEVGCNFTTYLMRIRIEKAKELLKDPRVKVYEAGNRVGYDDVKYFVKVFKEITGTTPAHYREKYL